MAKDPFLPFIEGVTKISEEVTEASEMSAELEEAYAGIDDLKDLGNLTRSCPDRINFPSILDSMVDSSAIILETLSLIRIPVQITIRAHCLRYCAFNLDILVNDIVVTDCIRASLLGKDGQPLTGGRRRLLEILLSAVALLLAHLYLTSCISRGSCTDKACSSSSLEFRDIYISILLFQAAYVWIKFRDVIPQGAVYHRRNSNKFEPRIKFPVMKSVGGKSKRIPLGLYDTLTEAEVAYRIAAFYCNKPKHCLGRIDLGGGASFHIPVLNLDPDRPYEEKVEQVQKQVMRVYAEFEEEKARRNLLPSVRGPTLEMPIGEGHVLPTSPIHQLHQSLDSRMDSSMQCQGSQLGPNILNEVNFNNPNVSLLLHIETQRKLIEAYEEIKFLKSRVSQLEFENMQLELKHPELEREDGLLEDQIMPSHPQPLHQEQDFDPSSFLDMIDS